MFNQSLKKYQLVRKRGFTIVELLVVLVLIGVLATLAIVALNAARMRTRDAKRISSIKQMQEALAMYENVNNSYPPAWLPGEPLTTREGDVIMSRMPANDRNGKEGACKDFSNVEFNYSPSGDSYVITYCLASDTAGIKAGRCIARPGVLCGNSITYGGYEYRLAFIGDQLWFAENLQIGEQIPATGGGSNNNIIERNCYQNNAEECNRYGGLYAWSEAIGYVSESIEGTQGICPAGWHIPTNADWQKLASLYPGESFGPAVRNEDFNGANESGFSVLDSGYVSSYQSQFGNRFPFFWSSSFANHLVANREYLVRVGRDANTFNLVHNIELNNYVAGSIRCLKD